MGLQGTSLKDFAELRDRLARALGTLSDVFIRVSATDRAAELAQSKRDLLGNHFRILVFGEMKRGKSTLINAMLGEPILPARGMPCTAVATSIKFGETKRAVLYPRPPHEPQEIDLVRYPQALWHALTIQDFGDGAGVPQRDGSAPPLAAHEYMEAEVFAPLGLCRNGVELQDSPGLNEDPERTIVALRLLRQADCVLIVLGSDQPLTEDERRNILEARRHRDARSLFVAWNRFDSIRDNAEDAEGLRRLSKARLHPILEGEVREYFVSASEALSGRMQGDGEKTRRSGMLDLEQALQDYLVNERAATKLRRPLSIAEHSVNEGLTDVLLQRERLYRLPLEVLRQRLEDAKPLLTAAEASRIKLLGVLDTRETSLTAEITVSLRNFGALLENGVPAQLKEVEVSWWDAIAKRRDVQQRMAQRIRLWMQTEIDKWQGKTLVPLLEARLTETEKEMEGHAESMIENLTAAKALCEGAAGGFSLTGDGDVSAVSRLLGAGLGFFGGVGTMMEGASLGAGHAAKGLALHIATGISMALMGFSLPVIAVVLAVIGIGRVIVGAESVADSLRRRAATELQAAIRAKLPDIEQNLLAKLRSDLATMRAGVDNKLAQRVNEVRSQIEDVLRHRDAEQKSVAVHIEELAHDRRTLQAVALELADLRAEIDPGANPSWLAVRVGQELEAKITAAVSMLRPAVTATGSINTGPSMAEIRRSLGKEAWARLETVQRLLAKFGQWRAEMEHPLALVWHRTATEFDRSAALQVVAYRAVYAVSLMDGEIMPPQPAEVRHRWGDPVFRKSLAAFYEACGGDPTKYFTEPPANDKGMDAFYQCYKRALETLEPSLSTPRVG